VVAEHERDPDEEIAADEADVSEERHGAAPPAR
jgi:hypothetical protein